MSKAIARKILCTVLLAGCSSNGPLAPSETYEGRFEMVELNGQWLPLVESSGDDCHVIYLGGWIELNRDGSFQMIYNRTAAICGDGAGRESYQPLHGTYSITGSQIRFYEDGSELRFTGTFSPHQTIGNLVHIGSIRFELRSHTYRFADVRRMDFPRL